MRTLLYSSIATIAFTTTAFATEPLPKDLINHTADLGVATAALGEPKTEASAHLESYIAKPKRIEKIRDEFGNIGVDIFQRAYAAKIIRRFGPLKALRICSEQWMISSSTAFLQMMF